MGSSAVLDKLDSLKQLYASGFQNDFLDTALQKIVQYQVARDKADLRQVDETLGAFERRYGLSSDEFWKRFRAGEMDDIADYMEWNVLCKARQRIVARIHVLQGTVADE